MKIAFLSYSQGKAQRGAETFVSEIAKRLSQDHEVDILSANKALPPRWPVLWRLYLDPSGLAVLIFTLRQISKIIRGKYNVIVPTHSGWQMLLVRLISLFTGARVLVSGQSGIGWDDRINLLAFPNAFVAISSKAFQWAKKFNPCVSSRYIPNGVDLKRFASKGDTYNTKLEKPIVICVGALVASKRIELTIKAVSKLENVSLLVVGSGELKNRIMNLGRELLRDRFELIATEHLLMPNFYRTADVFTLVPEQSEAFGIVYLEALASGLPVVAPDDEQRREIVSNAGLYIDHPENSERYAKVIQEALDKSWDGIPRQQAEKFSWDKIAQEYEKVLDEITK